MEPPFHEIVTAIEHAATTTPNLEALQQFAVTLIATRLPNYNWVGFYMVDPQDPNTLMLGPFHGAPTEHIRIPVTEGICGAAVAQGETIVIDDVNADPRYLACSIETRSEIVVPIRVHGQIVGEIDIDSHQLSAFGSADRNFVENCANIFGKLMEKK